MRARRRLSDVIDGFPRGPVPPAGGRAVRRRRFLKLAALGAGGASLTRGMPPEAASGTLPTDRSIIMIYLPGGPPQHETFDPKPEAPVEIRGAFSPISTCLPGVGFCELLPELSRLADRFSLVRTLVGMHNRHESFQCYTGRPGGRNGDEEPAGGWPTLGSVLSLALGSRYRGMPPYVDIGPAMRYGPYNNRGQHDNSPRVSWPGITGPQHVPFSIVGEDRANLVIQGIEPDRLSERWELLRAFGGAQASVRGGSESFQESAFELLSSSRLADALDLDREDPTIRTWYGDEQPSEPSLAGAPQSPQSLLLARRLVEAGVRCVTVAFGAWDWHGNVGGGIENLAKTHLPLFDHALAVLLQDLERRGLSSQVMVLVWGEFGRTPRINATAGRDHWPATQSVLLAGGGIRSGLVLGRTDRLGGEPVERPVHVQEVFATLYRNLGVDIDGVRVTDFQGRPHSLVDAGRLPVAELV